MQDGRCPPLSAPPMKNQISKRNLLRHGSAPSDQPTCGHTGPGMRQAAFSLVELMVVIAVIASLVALSVPAISAMMGGGKVNQTITELGGLLEQARQYAVSQNTHVWVVFNAATVDNSDTLSVAVVASKDGTDPGSYGAVPSDNFTLISKIRTFSQFKLQGAGYFAADKIPLLPASPAVSDPENSLSGSMAFSIRLPGGANAVTFDRSLQFTPSGEARNAGGPIDIIEFGLQPAKTASSPDANNVVAMRVNGLTGQTLVYRP